jgi:3-hydroxyisobutyrate dehydrogenase-like beta-hydroxyacid dehydrogenase
MGNRSFHVGPLGSGLAMKLVNNMLVQVNTVAVAEALVLGVKAGLDPQTIYEVVRVSTGASAAWELRVPRILKGDFAPGGDRHLVQGPGARDRLRQAPGRAAAAANLTQQVYQMARAQGLNKQDGAAIVKILQADGQRDGEGD